MNSHQALFHYDLLRRLDAVRRKRNLYAALRGAAVTGLVVVGAGLGMLVVEGILRSGVVIRTILFWAVILGGCGVAAWKVAVPLLKLARVLPDQSDLETAAEVGREIPAIRDHLLNGLQLVEERTRGAGLYSQELVDAALADLVDETRAVDFTSIITSSAAGRIGRMLAGACVLAAALFLLLPGFFLTSVDRLLHYSDVYAMPAPFTLRVDPGTVEVVKGESATVTVRVEGTKRNAVMLYSRPERQISFDERVLKPDADGAFRYEFRSVRESTVYYVACDEVRTEEFMLVTRDRPAIRGLTVSLRYPRYTGVPGRALEDNVGDVTAICGTEVTLTVTGSKQLAKAQAVFSDSTFLDLKVTGEKAQGAFVLRRNGQYHIDLRDSAGIPNLDPIAYTLRALPDAFPAVSIPVPGRDVNIAETESLPVVLRVSDDYGFTALRIAYRLAHSRYEQPSEKFTTVAVPLPPSGITETSVAFTWSIRDLSLVPEDVVEYYAEVFDNDNVSGPKSAVSETYVLRLPSTDEVFAGADSIHAASAEMLDDALRQAEEAKRQLQELQRNMRQEQRKPDWQAQQRTEELRRTYEEVQEKIDEAARMVEEMSSSMQKNQLLSLETLQKYKELQQLMEQLNSPELAEAMKRMQDAMQQLSPEAMRQALEQMQFSEENFRKSLDRTINLLKRVHIEQKVDELIQRTDALRKAQEELRKKTEQQERADSAGARELARRQEDINTSIPDLERSLDALKKMMEEFPREMPLDELQQAQDELSHEEMHRSLAESKDQLERQDLEAALQSQQRASDRLSSVDQRMRAMKSALQQNQMRAIVGELRKVQQDLLELSQREEDLKNQARGLGQNSPGSRENAQRQMDVARDLSGVADRMAGVAQKSFGVTPEMGKAVGNALRNMGRSVELLEQRNSSAAAESQEAAMASLNEAAQMVESSLNALMQGGGQGMGMTGFMQRLRQLSGMQESINKGTQGVGGMTQEQAAAMARLAGEQGMVRKSLEQLAREAAASGDLNRLLGDLNRVAQEMREVQTDLAQGNVTPETLKKQERILSRLLDSQRALTERDFERRRQAQSGMTVARQGPLSIDLSTKEGKERLRRDLLKALEEGYAPDYQELIKRYFEALER